MGLDNPTHLLLIALVIVLLFGAKRLPGLGRQLGKGIRDVKSSVGIDEIVSTPKQLKQAITEPAKPPVTPVTSETPGPETPPR